MKEKIKDEASPNFKNSNSSQQSHQPHDKECCEYTAFTGLCFCACECHLEE